MLKIDNKHYKQLIQTMLVAFILFFSRTALIFREVLIASKFGATDVSDQFYLILSFVMFFSNFVGISILSVYTSKIAIEDRAFKQQEFKGFFFIFGSILFLINLSLIVLYFYLKGELYWSTLLQTFFMSCSLPFSIMSYYNQALLNARGSFKKYASVQIISPVIFMILLSVVPSQYLEWLSFYYLLSILAEYFYSEKMENSGFKGVTFSASTALNFFSKNIEKGFVLTLLAALISNSKIIVDNIMARDIAAGASAILNYGMRLTGGISNFFAFLVSMYSIKYFADLKKNSTDVPKKNFLSASTLLFLFLTVFTLGLFIFSKEITSLMYNKAQLSPEEFLEIVEIQKFYSFQLIFGVLGTLSMRMLITYEQFSFVLKLSIATFILNIFFNLYFSKYYGIAGISLSSSVSYALIFIIHVAQILRLKNKN